ncbi:MAG: class I SAM-dependent methyltransferase [Acidimicrobiia bacterium]
MGSLRDAWEAQAHNWAAWARTPGHDSFFWRLNLPSFLEIVPSPGRLTLDIGCGEGRVGRALQERGHCVVGFDGSPTLARLAAENETSRRVVVADAAALPAVDACADLAIAFMSLQDVDDMVSAVGEAARVVVRGGRLCLAIMHPISTTGLFDSDGPESDFRLLVPYFEPFRYALPFERDGLEMTFAGMHRPLVAYADALAEAGFLIETIREPVPDDDLVSDVPEMARQRKVPAFLHICAVRTGA